MSAPPLDLGQLRARYEPVEPPSCPLCDRYLELVVRGECAPPSDLYRCPEHPDVHLTVRRQGDPAVIRLVEAYEQLTEQVKIRKL